MPPPETMIVIAVDEALQKWQGKKPVEVIRDKPLPDVNTLNEATDKNTWEIGLDNKPKPPWVHSYLVVLARSGDGDDLTAAKICAGRGHHYACVAGSPRRAGGELTHRPMKTFVGMKQRPEFEIVDWRQLGGDSGSSGRPAIAAVPGAEVQAGPRRNRSQNQKQKFRPEAKPELKPSVAMRSLRAGGSLETERCPS